MTTHAVWKYELATFGPTVVVCPAEAEVLAVGMQRRDAIAVWMLVDVNTSAVETRHFVSIMTGQQWQDDPAMELGYLDTLLVEDGELVLHVFEGFPKDG